MLSPDARPRANMSMSFTVPEQLELPGVDTRVPALREWIEELPYADPVSAARQCLRRLQDINHQRIAPAHRLELLGLFYSAMLRLHEPLRGRAGVAEIHSPSGQARGLLTDLTQHMLFGYKYAINELLEGQPRRGRLKPLAEAINHCVQFIGLYMTCRFQNYCPVDDLLWAELGELLHFAQEFELAATEVSDDLFGKRQISADHGYRVIALLLLADPFRLPQGSVWEAYRYLDRHAGEAVLHAGPGQPQPGCFSLPPDRHPTLDAEPPVDGWELASWRWIDARGLLHLVRQHIDALMAETGPARVGLSPNLTRTDAVQLLTRMYSQWTHPRERRTQRYEAQQPIEIFAGLASVFALVNRGRPFDPGEVETITPDEQIDMSRMPAFDVAAAQGGDAHNRIQGEMQDRGAGGLRVSVPVTAARHLRVGQLIAVQTSPGTAAWLIAVVRWLRIQSQGKAEVGIQYLARHANPAAVRPAQTEEPAAYQAALCLQLEKNGASVPILITAKGTFRNGRVLELNCNRQQLRVRCTRLLESAGPFERFCYEPT